MMRIGAPSAQMATRPLDVRVAIVNRLQAAGNASSPTSLPVKSVDAAPQDIHLRRVSAHVLDIRA
jgi:hypothetical protein